MQHLVTQVEPFSQIFAEVKPLVERHWEEIALNKDSVVLDPDWQRYIAMERLGQLSIVTVRAQGRLVGYCCMVIQPGLHYRSCLEARMDVFWLAPEYRGRMGGVRLFRAVEAELKRRGVRRMFVGSKLHKDSSRLFEAMGYKPIEHWFSKMLDNS
jgi:GNAT superfamily N-acetyltransferase